MSHRSEFTTVHALTVLLAVGAGCTDSNNAFTAADDATPSPVDDGTGPTPGTVPADPGSPAETPALTPSAGTPSSPSPDATNPNTPAVPPSQPALTPIDDPLIPLSPFIVVDQFGYLPSSEKIAVIRSPMLGFDAGENFAPGSEYQLVAASSTAPVLTAAPSLVNDGTVHEQSGDVAWHFDFSEVSDAGAYYVLDVANQVRSDTFWIADNVYAEVLKHAVRTFFYQRAGFEKTAEHAGEAWADAASHIGPGQDLAARLFSDVDNPATERDVSGGWYDAGDFNKYTAWTADYVTELARAYHQRPVAFTDDYNIPESGNGIPDIIDELSFGAHHLMRLQEPDGSVLSIVDMAHASPPSAATEPSRYGPASTNATIRTATALAYAGIVLEPFDGATSAEFIAAAEAAWTWAAANPNVVFQNNDGTNDLGAGQQEPPTGYVQVATVVAGITLYRATGNQVYKDYVESNFNQANYDLFEFGGGWLSGYELEFTDAYLEYAVLPDADPALAASMLDPFKNALAANNNLGMLQTTADPYLAHADDVGWGSNAHKARIGLLMHSYVDHDIDVNRTEDARRAAERYIHYLHGVNPLSLVYLTNMEDLGAARSASQIYHAWFSDGTDWDEAGVSLHGPPPGFVPGGPNPNYSWDVNWCPSGDGCPAEQLTPPFGQPPQKAYTQFNDNWPLASWEVTENSNGYQAAYIRLLSKFVN